jgi:NADH-quinone oxidoreductase subunit N
MIEAPDISYAVLAPLLIVFGAACIGVLVEAFVPREVRHAVQVGVALLGALGGLVSTLLLAGRREVSVGGALVVDGPALFLQATIAGLGALSILLFAERALDPARSAFVSSAAVPVGSPQDRDQLTAERVQTEVYPLATFAIGGMMLFVSSNDLLIMFVALEVLSLPLYLISGLARRRRLLSQEAAVKYFLLGAFASGFFLYGLALVYGATGTIRLSEIRQAAGAGETGTLLVLGLALLVVGLLFKASVAPFHTWTPDVYQGAPTAVTAFMAACTKVAAFGAILRLLYVAFGTTEWTWRPLIYGVAIVSMVVGAVLGLTQTDLKRMLAYSSIAHAASCSPGSSGWAAARAPGWPATMFYLLTYGLTTLRAFRRPHASPATGTAWPRTVPSGRAASARRSLAAVIEPVFLLRSRAIPLTAGITGQVRVFPPPSRPRLAPGTGGPARQRGGGFFYLRSSAHVLSPTAGGATGWPDPPSVVPGLPTTIVLAVTAAETLALGIVPGSVLELADRAARFIG